MANVKKCDRCYQMFTPNEKDSLILHKVCSNGYQRTIDLCPYCAKRFEDFMFNLKLGKEKDNGSVY